MKKDQTVRMPSDYPKLTWDHYRRDVLSHPGVAIVCYMADWCEPCRDMMPILDGFQKRRKGHLNIVVVDADKKLLVPPKERVDAVPTFDFYNSGVWRERLVGRQDQKRIRAAINIHGAGRLPKLNDATFENRIKKQDAAAFVYFQAKWCRPCREMRHAVRALADHVYPQIPVYTVNVDESPMIAAKEGIRAIPHIAFYDQGLAHGARTGRASAEEIITFADRVLPEALRPQEGTKAGEKQAGRLVLGGGS